MWLLSHAATCCCLLECRRLFVDAAVGYASCSTSSQRPSSSSNPPGPPGCLPKRHRRFCILTSSCTLCALAFCAPLQVRSGPVELPLLKKPVDLSLRRVRRLTSRGPDLHISVRGVAGDA